MPLHQRPAATVVLALLGLFASVGGTAAYCPIGTSFGADDHYVFTPGVCPSGDPCPGPTSVTESFAGSFWEVGQGDPRPGFGVDGGTWPVREETGPDQTGWVRSYPGQPAHVEGWWGVDSRADGCLASECMAIMFSDQAPPPLAAQGFFGLVTKRETAGFGFVLDSDIVLAPIPAPRIVAQSGPGTGGGSVQLRIRVDAPTAGVQLDAGCTSSVLRGYKIYQIRRLHSPDPDDSSRSAWSLAAGGEGPGGAPIPFGSEATIVLQPWCNGWSYYFAASLVFDSGFETAHLSRFVRGPMGVPEWTDEDCDGVQPWWPDGQTVLDCNDGDASVYPGAPQICDHKNNDCNHSSWPSLDGTNEAGPDLDADSWTGSCDNCPVDPNPSQSDRNGDGVGDGCDLQDGLILLRFADRGLVEWQEDQGFDSWNLYRGSLDVLRTTGAYTQAPGSNPIAGRECGIATPSLGDSAMPASNQVAFYLVTGTSAGVEGDLGTNGAGQIRPNTSPCP